MGLHVEAARNDIYIRNKHQLHSTEYTANLIASDSNKYQIHHYLIVTLFL